MKYFIMLCLVFGMVSCSRNNRDLDLPLLTDPPTSTPPKPPESEYKGHTNKLLLKNNNGFNGDFYFYYILVNIDGCEYIYCDQKLTHKANCPNHGPTTAEKQ